MKKTYVIMPTEWDTSTEQNINHIKNLRDTGCFVPCDIIDVSERCGALIGVNSRTAINIAKSLKEDYPFITFELLEGETWGDLRPLQTF